MVAPLAAASVLLFKVDQPTINRFAQRPAPWAMKTSRAGDAATLLGSSLALYGVGRFTHHDTVSQMGSSSLAAITHSYLITQVLKASTRRQRPDASNHWSTPSGHAMTSFAMAGALAAHPKAPRWLKIVAPAAAGAIAFSRVGARKHYPSDVAIGSTFGWFIGRAVSHR